MASPRCAAVARISSPAWSRRSTRASAWSAPTGSLANVRRTNERVVAALEASDLPPRVVILGVVAVPDLEITAVAGMHDLARRAPDDRALRGRGRAAALRDGARRG
jgi:hypothetical protein